MRLFCRDAAFTRGLTPVAGFTGTGPQCVARHDGQVHAIFSQPCSSCFWCGPGIATLPRHSASAQGGPYDTGLVLGDDGVRFENLVACSLLKQVQWQQDGLDRKSICTTSEPRMALKWIFA